MRRVAAEDACVRGRADAELFIYPGFEFQVIVGLMTNFHLPKSSLLMLVAAFAGRERVLDAYREAVAQRLSVLQLRRRDADSLSGREASRARGCGLRSV